MKHQIEENYYSMLEESADFLKAKKNNAKIGIILGSGLGGITEKIKFNTNIPYQEIPNFPVSTVKGHSGQLIFGELNGVEVVLLAGRFHFYEGYSMKEVVYPVYVMKMLGIETLIVSNACGSTNLDFVPGDLMLLDDFINLQPSNPLIGTNDERLGVRFPDMTEPFDLALQEKALRKSMDLGIKLETGVYAAFPGPYYESRAEVQMIKKMGADAVGMSTVPETIAANHAGMKVLGISMITNMATGIQKTKHSHENVVNVANQAGDKFVQLILELLPDLC